MNTRDAAVAAARRGWAVFPCIPGDKRPAIDHWEQRASADPGHVAVAWQARYRDHNIGVACGPSGLVVLDLDTHGELPLGWRDEPGVHDGKDVLAVKAEQAGQPWPETWLVATPTGGWHLYYRAVPGIEIRNSAGKIGPMVDVRGCGGYVVAAGSVTPAGLYETLSGPGEQPEPLPPWLLLHIRPPPSPVSHAPEPREVPALRRLHGVLDAALESGLRGGESEARRTIASGLRSGGLR